MIVPAHWGKPTVLLEFKHPLSPEDWEDAVAWLRSTATHLERGDWRSIDRICLYEHQLVDLSA